MEGGGDYASAANEFLQDNEEELLHKEPPRSAAAATIDSPYYEASRERQLRSPSARSLREPPVTQPLQAFKGVPRQLQDVAASPRWHFRHSLNLAQPSDSYGSVSEGLSLGTLGDVMYENDAHGSAASKALLKTSHLHAKGLLHTRRYKQAAASLQKGGIGAIFDVKPMVYPSGHTYTPRAPEYAATATPRMGPPDKWSPRTPDETRPYGFGITSAKRRATGTMTLPTIEKVSSGFRPDVGSPRDSPASGRMGRS